MIQSNRDRANSTVDGRKTFLDWLKSDRIRTVAIAGLETTLIWLIFAAVTGTSAPDVNESHYLTKAKHFWNPNWCPGDLFLSSSFSHWLFYFLFGWITQFVSLSTFAWIGRALVWLALAVAYRRLSWRITPQLMLAPLGAILFLLLNLRFHLAGEWVVGGFEAKGLAYTFVLLALGDLVTDRWRWVWLWLGAAGAFHVLVGGWALLAFGFVWIMQVMELKAMPAMMNARSVLRSDRGLMMEIKTQVPFLLLGLVLLVIGAIPPLLADQGATAVERSAAALIYVNQRISHHLMFGAFPTSHVARFVMLLLAWFACFRFLRSRSFLSGLANRHRQAIQIHKLYFFGVASLLISLGGLLLSGLAESSAASEVLAAKLLRFYWFRLADFAIPVTLALILTNLIGTWLGLKNFHPRKICGLFSIAATIAALTLMMVEQQTDRRPLADQRTLPEYPGEPVRTQQTFQNWRSVCDWIAANTPADAIFMTPHEQQTFKWYAGRTEIVNWKDVPQDASAMLEWSRRVTDLLEPQKRFPLGLMSYSDEQLATLAETYHADYLVVPQWQLDSLSQPTTLKQVYPEPGVKATFVVLRF